MRALVIGGEGCFGRGVVEALRALPDAEVRVGGRRDGSDRVRVDLDAPGTFGALDDFDLVVDCANTSASRPDAAIDHCLRTGQTFIEASADPATIERLLDEVHKPLAAMPWRGRVLLGMGTFPGLSNLLAADLARETGEDAPIDLVIRTTPFAAAGAGMVDLMVDLLAAPAWVYERGARRTLPTGTRGPVVDLGGRRGRGLLFRFAEVEMLRRSQGLANLAVWFAPSPGLLVGSLGAMARLGLGRGSLGRAANRAAFAFLRRFLLAWRKTPFVATAASGNRFRTIVAREGVRAGGYAVAAAARLLDARGVAPGIYLPDELFTLEEIVAEADRLSDGGLGIRLTRGDAS
ncbi:MAG: hypothetical protein KC466_01680 [Myxococcales bacterium]|nr:hypothetical protein [Myxococcales bacterium]